MSAYPRVLEQLIEELQRLPSIGRKSAERLAFHLLRAPREQAMSLSRAIAAVQDEVSYCATCFNLSDRTPCPACGPERDGSLICVVQEPKDILTLEKTGRYQGSYHVLLGRVAPLEGHSSDSLTLDGLERRLAAGGVEELIIATPPDLEGDTTALFVSELAARHGIRATRLARGIPTGASLEHTSAAILGDALAARREVPKGSAS